MRGLWRGSTARCGGGGAISNAGWRSLIAAIEHLDAPRASARGVFKSVGRY
jgi:hypothetical protein